MLNAVLEYERGSVYTVQCSYAVVPRARQRADAIHQGSGGEKQHYQSKQMPKRCGSTQTEPYIKGNQDRRYRLRDYEL
jgi:hypothetical protein